MELGQIWRRVGRQQVFPLNPLTGFVGFFGLRDHLISDHGLRQLAETTPSSPTRGGDRSHLR